MTIDLNTPILVTGASGQLGSRVVELLIQAGAKNITAASRSPEKLSFAGVKTVRADFDSPETLDAAFAGMERVLIISTDAIDTNGTRARQHVAAVEAAKRASVNRVIYTSLVNPVPASPVMIASDHWQTEEAIRKSGLAHTILRNAVYMEGVLMGLAPAFASGQWYVASGQGKQAYVTREDCARAAAAALLAAEEEDRVLDISGPELLDAETVASIASEVTGKPLAVVHLPDDALRGGMVSAGLPEPVADLLVSFDKAAREGFAEVHSNAVAELSGQPAQDLRKFLTQNKAALAA